MESIANICLWLAGVKLEVLERCPGERRKLVALGALVGVTGAFAFCAAFFTLAEFKHVFVGLAVVLALGWSAAIMAIDRYFIVAIRRAGNRWLTFAMAVPRVAVAVVAGLVIAKPVTVWVFGNEVAAQAEEEKTQRIRADQLAFDRKYAEIPTLETQVHALGTNAVVAGSGLDSNGAYAGQQAEATRLQNQARAQRAKAEAEQGGYGGSHKAGQGPIYQEKVRAAERLEAEASSAQQKANNTRSAILDEERTKAGEATKYANDERGKLEARLATLRGERSKGEAEIATAQSKPIGLGDRLDALNALGRKHGSVGNFKNLIGWLMLLIDSAPALAKLLMVLGRPSLYEQEVERDDAAVAEQNQYERELQLEQHKLECDERCDIHHRRGAAEANKIEAKRPVVEAEHADEAWRDTVAQSMESIVAGERERIARYVDRFNARANDEFDRRVREAENAEPVRRPTSPEPAGPTADETRPASVRDRILRSGLRGGLRRRP